MFSESMSAATWSPNERLGEKELVPLDKDSCRMWFWFSLFEAGSPNRALSFKQAPTLLSLCVLVAPCCVALLSSHLSLFRFDVVGLVLDQLQLVFRLVVGRGLGPGRVQECVCRLRQSACEVHIVLFLNKPRCHSYSFKGAQIGSLAASDAELPPPTPPRVTCTSDT